MLAVSRRGQAVKTLHLADDEELLRGCGSHHPQATSPENALLSPGPLLLALQTENPQP